MTEEDKVDLSPLDPARDPARWDTLVRGVASRALAAHRARNTLAFQIAAWGRPALAAAAALAIVSWALAWSSDSGEMRTSADTTQPAAYQLAGWAATGKLPETPQMMSALGGSND